MYFFIKTIILASLLAFLAYISLKKEQNITLNWSMFYACLFIIVFLPILNYVCVKLNYWTFCTKNILNMPFDIYFIWVIIWSILPVYLLKGKYLLSTVLAFLLLDLSLMPILENQGLFILHENWIIGEVLMLIFIFIPSYYWAYLSYNKKHHALRAVFQIIIIACLFLIVLPVLMKNYNWIDYINFNWSFIQIQLFLIIVFPSLVAVKNLVSIGKGTPFPYDPTTRLVQSGVYAYCKNPIQWSCSLIFILLSFYHSSIFFLIGFVFSIAYSFGVSDYQEYSDMEQRFGEKWLLYKKSVPKWYFQWKPKGIPNGEIYFDYNCNQCNELKQWFEKKDLINLSILNAGDFEEFTLKQVTYIDEFGEVHLSVYAIANALNHVNLAYASVGWFIQFPIIGDLLQIIIDALGLFKINDFCNKKIPSQNRNENSKH